MYQLNKCCHVISQTNSHKAYSQTTLNLQDCNLADACSADNS